MATKELLIMILVTVIVAISVAVAFQTIKSGEFSPNRSAILQGMNDAIGQSKAYYNRPVMYGGGQYSFDEISFEDLLIDSMTAHGTYEITERTPTSFRLTGYPSNTNEALTVVIFADSIIWE